jgi:hypothetical protein
VSLQFRQLKQPVTATEHSQEINLHLYIQYSGFIAQYAVCLVLLSTDDHGTDTGLDTQYSTNSLLHSLMHCAFLPLLPLNSAFDTCSPLYARHLPTVAQLSIYQPSTKELFNHSCITALLGPITDTLNHDWDCANINDCPSRAVHLFNTLLIAVLQCSISFSYKKVPEYQQT